MLNLNNLIESSFLNKDSENSESTRTNNENQNKFPTVGLKSLLQNSELLDILLKPLTSLNQDESEYLKKNKQTSEVLNIFPSELNNTDQNDLLKTKSLLDFENDDIFDLSKISNGDSENSSKIYGNAFLRPNLWEKSDLFQNEKFGVKFEYLEMDEFLNENGLNETDVEFLDQLQKYENNSNGQRTGSQALNLLNNAQSNNNNTNCNSSQIQSPNSTITTSVSSPTSSSSSLSTSSPSLSLSPISNQIGQTIQSHIEPLNLPNNISNLNNVTTLNSLNQVNRANNSSTLPVQTRTITQPQVAFSNVKIQSKNKTNKDLNLNENSGSNSSSNSKQTSSTRLNSFDWSVDDNDISLDSMSDFDDEDSLRLKKFDDLDIKFQPILKKSKKQFVPNELKDEKYWARRRKNNVAAKRSRDARRMKENHIAIKASYLERENDLLRKQLEDYKKETKLLKVKLARYESVNQQT